MHKLLPILITVISLLPISCLQALAEQDLIESPLATARRVQLKLDDMQSLSFNFYQQTRGAMSGRPKKGSGKAVFYKKDGNSRMRWDYSSPDKQVLVSDGKTFSMYFAGLKQMIITPAASLDNELTYSFFTGRGDLENDFYILPPEEEAGVSTDEFKIIKLVPKQPQSQVQDVHIWVTESSLIRRMNIRDHFGTITVLSFSDILVDSLVALDEQTVKTLFSFTPPEGTEIIE